MKKYTCLGLKKNIVGMVVLVSILLLSFSSISKAEALQVVVSEKITPILMQPDENSEIILEVPEGTLLDATEKSGNWYRVTIPTGKASSQKTGFVSQDAVREITTNKNNQDTTSPKTDANRPAERAKKTDRLFLMGMGMLRLNWTGVKGDEIRFRYSDLGLPTDFSTRERASFMVDGTFGDGKYSIDGYLNYDPENRITEPPLEFLLNVGNDKTYLSLGDYHQGVLLDSVFSRYYHPFRGGIIGAKNTRFGVEALAGLSRGESGIEELSADLGAGPYYLADAPIIRGSEVIYLVTRSFTNPDLEISRTALLRSVDYYIDYDRGSILFTRSLYPFDPVGNPVAIFVTYQFESLIGQFTRAVMGFRAFASPFKALRLNLSYIADADKNQDLGDIFKNRRGIYAVGLNIDSKPLTFFGEASFSAEPGAAKQNAYFGGGIWTITDKLRLFFNSWSLDADFPTFANRQLEYGYSLFQIFPTYAERNIFLSPFQFTRNLGAEIYPFSLARLSIDEKETHGFLEWEDKTNRFSLGYGTRTEMASALDTDIFYISSFHDGEKTKVWGKFGVERDNDAEKVVRDTKTTDLLAGVRQKLKQFSKGDLFLQADFKNDWLNDFLNLTHDTRYQTYSTSLEYLTGSEGYFAAYRKELLNDREDDKKLLEADIYELGILRHLYKGFFVDSRYRKEESSDENGDTDNDILSLGAGLETKKVRAMARYEVQVNRSDANESRRKLWSFFFYGAPLKRMSISFRYYHQIGKDDIPFSLTERSEEQLSLRFLWRPWEFLNLYSQWRYDTNLELYPPLDGMQSDSLAEVHGLKLTLSRRFEFLANYKLLKVWGPIDNRKYAAAAELGYLLQRHFRLGIGVEVIDFEDITDIEADYRSTVGYFKLVALY